MPAFYHTKKVQEPSALCATCKARARVAKAGHEVKALRVGKQVGREREI